MELVVPWELGWLGVLAEEKVGLRNYALVDEQLGLELEYWVPVEGQMGLELAQWVLVEGQMGHELGCSILVEESMGLDDIEVLQHSGLAPQLLETTD